jgi:hypothetical protein
MTPSEIACNETWEGEYLNAVKIIDERVIKDPRIK